MFKKLICLVSVVLALLLVGSASAQMPPGWISEDIGTPTPGDASESNGTWEVTGNGNDIWNTGDNFHYVYWFLEGDGEITARVVDNGSGSNAWAKGGVMIRQNNSAGSAYTISAVTGGNGGGACFQWRDSQNAGAAWPGAHISNISPPYWVRLTRQGDSFTSYFSADGVTWQASPDQPHTVNMTDPVLVGLCVTSHAAGELRTFTFDNVSATGNVYGLMKANKPDPADGSTYPQTWATLSWESGGTAASHDIYFGDNFDDVNDGTGDTFQSNQTSMTYILGFPGFAFPDGLVPGTTYYWRIDEVDADGVTKYKGDIWSFTVPPRKAYQPVPGDGTMFVPTDATLEWTGGFNAKLHYVYFGDDPDAVANATGGTPVSDTSFNPGPMENNKTYYWRVDEFDPPLTHTGDVWSFTTTLSGLGTAVMERWENIPGTDINALKDNAKYPNNPDVTETVNEFKWDGPDLSDYGARIEAWLYAPATGDYTFWLASDDQGELWLSPDDDPSNVQLIAYVKDSPTATGGWTNITEWTKYASQKSEPIKLVAGEKYYIMAIWKEGSGGDHCNVAWEGPGISSITTIPGSNLSPFEPMSAYGAKPANRATGVKQTPTLNWKPGIQAQSHEVYFGADEAAVTNATKASPEYKGSKALGEETFEPGSLPWDSTFYWRVDEVAAGNPDSPWVGSVWSFTTADYLVVENFEEYTDDDANNEAVWQTWLDGFSDNTNGSQMGNAVPPYMEITTVQQGRQSVEMFYNNTAGVTNSEVELSLDNNTRDWTSNGVDELSLWFHGRPASTGSFVEGPAGTFTMTGSGADIWNNGPAGNRHDEFHFAYKTLTGAGTIIARVDSVQNTNDWAKAGVMIRETLDGGSRHAFGCVTPANGVASQGRIDSGADSFNTAEGGITAPHWIKLERDLAGTFTVSHSTDGSTWVPVAGAVPENIQMGSTVFVGLAVTSHDAALTCEAVFSNVTITGNVTGQWQHQDIGIASNAAEPLYVGIANATGAPAIVTNSDPLAANIDAWTEWRIPLSDFAAKGINLADVRSMFIGLGAKGGAAAGGTGAIFLDNITLQRPAPEPQP